jgi:hypothetical protein
VRRCEVKRREEMMEEYAYQVSTSISLSSLLPVDVMTDVGHDDATLPSLHGNNSIYFTDEVSTPFDDKVV